MKRILSNLKEMREDPRQRLELLLNIVALLAGYYYFYIYQDVFNINVPLLSLKSLLAMPLIATVIIPLIRYLIIRPDPLQRSPSKTKHIAFFQNEFPSAYILERCQRCHDNEETCENFITEESKTHIRIWMHEIFHGPIEKENPSIVNETYEKGYTCKLMYYTSWIFFIFSIGSFLTILIPALTNYIFTHNFALNISRVKIISPVFMFIAMLLILYLNSANHDNPSGCWHAWREINRIHISWMKKNDDLLNKSVCQVNNANKEFRTK